jgi:hypothetical protein
METILKKAGYILLLCLAIPAIWFAIYTIADYVIHQFLMYRKTDTTFACALFITGFLPFFVIHTLLSKILQAVQEIRDLLASEGKTTTSSNTSRPKRVFVGGKFVKVDDVEDVTPKNGGTSSTPRTPQGGNNSSWRVWAEKAQETAGKWANAAWDTATPWAKAQGEAVVRHAEQKPLIFWGGGLILMALLVASKSVTLFACLVLAAIACFVSHKNKAAIGEALSKLGPVSVACILVVVGGMLAYDEVEAGLVLILMGWGLLGLLVSHHVYDEAKSLSKGFATAGAYLLLTSFVFFVIELRGYALQSGVLSFVAFTLAGVMYWFTKKYPPAKKTKEDLEAELAKAKAGWEKELLKIQLAMMEKKTDEIKAKAEAVKAMQAAGASEDAINEAVKRMFGGQQQRKKK